MPATELSENTLLTIAASGLLGTVNPTGTVFLVTNRSDGVTPPTIGTYSSTNVAFVLGPPGLLQNSATAEFANIGAPLTINHFEVWDGVATTFVAAGAFATPFTIATAGVKKFYAGQIVFGVTNPLV